MEAALNYVRPFMPEQQKSTAVRSFVITLRHSGFLGISVSGTAKHLKDCHVVSSWRGVIIMEMQNVLKLQPAAGLELEELLWYLNNTVQFAYEVV